MNQSTEARTANAMIDLLAVRGSRNTLNRISEAHRKHGTFDPGSNPKRRNCSSGEKNRVQRDTQIMMGELCTPYGSVISKAMLTLDDEPDPYEPQQQPRLFLCCGTAGSRLGWWRLRTPYQTAHLNNMKLMYNITHTHICCICSLAPFLFSLTRLCL